MNQNCANGGKCTWLLKTNVTVGLSLCVTGDLERLALCAAKEDRRNLPAAEMSPVELTVVGQKREGEEQLHGGEGEVCLRDTQPMLPSDRQRWRKGSGGEGKEKSSVTIVVWGKGKVKLSPSFRVPPSHGFKHWL